MDTWGIERSFPTRERGLKSWMCARHSKSPCRSPRGNVDWNLLLEFEIVNNSGRSPRGNVDWNDKHRGCAKCDHSRSPRGNVDWNHRSGVYYWWYDTSFPTRERGLKYRYPHRLPYSDKVSFPTRERGLKYEWHVVIVLRSVLFPTWEHGSKSNERFKRFHSIEQSDLYR